MADRLEELTAGRGGGAGLRCGVMGKHSLHSSCVEKTSRNTIVLKGVVRPISLGSP